MVDADWTQVRVEVGLIHEVDKIVQRERIFGAKKYFSRNDFVKDAVLRLVQQYQEDYKAAKGKKLGEEILVTGK